MSQRYAVIFEQDDAKQARARTSFTGVHEDFYNRGLCQIDRAYPREPGIGHCDQPHAHSFPTSTSCVPAPIKGLEGELRMVRAGPDTAIVAFSIKR